ncbi:MAG: trypsin-like peptidase domain-containing protein [Oscillospiraceae bacterium]|nr:trypsin-like peptidase domain-containing protein [Oscillospiraceae bacterium]
MDEFEKNEMNESPVEEVKEEPNASEQAEPSAGTERNTNAPSGWTYSANTNQYVSWDGNGDPNNTHWNPGPQPRTEQQPPRREYGTQYGYYGGPQQTNYYSSNGNYQWDFNKYESAEAAKAPKKKSSGKGFKVFIGIIAAVLCICVISLTSVGIYKLITAGNNELGQTLPGNDNIIGSQDGQQNETETPDISLHDVPKDGTVSTDGSLSATEVYKAVSPSVVGVVQYQYSYSLEPAGSGSGIIISDDGYIVTNAHVIEGAETVKVVLYNEEEYEALVVGSDSQTDIAVLKIGAKNLVSAEFGDSEQVEIGETVYAIGNPGGLTLQSSFTDGIISGLNRVISTDDSVYTMTVLQTNAAINPGNSGGALVNEYGQVIGITSSKIVSTDYEGIGFAIPTATAKPIIEEIITNGYVSGRPKLGISCTTIDSVTAKYYEVPEGVQIITIEEDSCFIGTEAKVGDIIIAFDGKEVTSLEDLQSYLAECSPGDMITITLYRYSATRMNDLTLNVTVKLAESKG